MALRGRLQVVARLQSPRATRSGSGHEGLYLEIEPEEGARDYREMRSRRPTAAGRVRRRERVGGRLIPLDGIGRGKGLTSGRAMSRRN